MTFCDIAFRELIEGLFNTMQETGADFTNTFRCLSDIPLPGAPDFDVKVFFYDSLHLCSIDL